MSEKIISIIDQIDEIIVSTDDHQTLWDLHMFLYAKADIAARKGFKIYKDSLKEVNNGK